MSSSTELQESIDNLEYDLEQAHGMLELSKALNALDKNSDFKKVITDGYCKDYALRLVSLLASPQCATPEQRETTQRALDSISEFQQYTYGIESKAVSIQAMIDETEAELTQARTELAKADD